MTRQPISAQRITRLLGDAGYPTPHLDDDGHWHGGPRSTQGTPFVVAVRYDGGTRKAPDALEAYRQALVNLGYSATATETESGPQLAVTRETP